KREPAFGEDVPPVAGDLAIEERPIHLGGGRPAADDLPRVAKLPVMMGPERVERGGHRGSGAMPRRSRRAARYIFQALPHVVLDLPPCRRNPGMAISSISTP